MATTFTYPITDTLFNRVALRKLDTETRDSGITIHLLGWTQTGSNIRAEFATDISTAEETILDGVVAAHDGIPSLLDPSPILIDGFTANLTTLPVDISQVTVVPECPTMSNDFKVEYSDTNISMTSSYATIYSYSGSGKFHGFALDFNSDSVRVKLEIDGNEVFALTLDEVEGMQAFSSSGCDDDSGAATGLVNMLKKASGNRLYFSPPCPIKYTSSVTVSGQRTGSSNKTMDKQMMFLEKTT